MTIREQLENPELFRINRMKAHSDHTFLPDVSDIESGTGRPEGEPGFWQCLDGEWIFHYSERLEERPVRFFEENFELFGFETIRVPGHMELQGHGTPQYINTLYPWDGVEMLRPPRIPKNSTPVGSYILFFDLERVPEQGGEVFLHFGGVETAFSVWLNGTYVGYSEDSFTPSEFCVTELIREKNNRLAVEVYKRSSASWIEDQDFWRFSGIFRSVYAVTVPSEHVYDLSVRADYLYRENMLDEYFDVERNTGLSYDAGTGLLFVDALVLSEEEPDPSKVELSLVSNKGTAVSGYYGGRLLGSSAENEGDDKAAEHLDPADLAELTAIRPYEVLAEESLILTEEQASEGAFGDGTSAREVALRKREKKLWRLKWKLAVPDVSPWSAESPSLYRLVIRLAGKERVLQDVGFRSFKLEEGVMCLNGKRIIFRGVNRHEFSLNGGRCISLEDMKKDVQLIKMNNMNAVRTCHYPNRSEWYQMCDRAGIYLIDETNLESHGSWQKLGRVEPSWNVPGDLPEWRAAVVDRAESMYERDKNHPSVLIWSCGNESYAGEGIAAMSAFFSEKDKRRLVHYEGCFHRPEYRYVSHMESRMYAKPVEVAAYLEEEMAKKAADPDYDMKPYISCEYMHAMGNSLGGMQLYTELEDRYTGYQGGFIWDYIDQVLPMQLPEGEEVMAVGGDFDDRPTDYGFCTNGIVYGDRTPSPKMQEVRQLYSPIRLDISPETLTVENRNLFVDTSGYRFYVRTMLDGKLLEEKEISVTAAAGETVTVPHGLRMPEGQGLAVLEAAAVTDPGSGCPAYETAFAQCVTELGIRKGNGFAVPGSIISGDGYVGIQGPDWQIQFSMSEGGISSYRFGGREYIDRIPRISFWRAMTDNDRGAGYPAEMGLWHAAGHFMRKEYDRFRIEPTEGGLKLVTVFSGGPKNCVEVTVCYTVCPDGQILVEADYPGVKGLPELPVFALDFCTKASVDQVEYLGLGPEENYTDRAAGARLGRFGHTAYENLSGYLRPQECGNRTGVRELAVTGQDGRGLRFTAEGAPFEMSVLPYSAYELEEAERRFELPPVRHTWIRIAAQQMGVGGDDSWGAPVHDEYRIDSSKPQHIGFRISPVERTE